MESADQRWHEIRKYHKEYNFFYVLCGGLLLVLFGIWLGWQIFPAEKLTDYNINLWNTLIGTGITVLVIDRLNGRRQERELQNRLVRDAGSRANSIAVHAVDQLRKYEWLEGDKGLLKGEDLVDANLRGAGLAFANLDSTNLGYAKLSNANLYMGNMKGAILWRSEVRSAILKWANMEGAILAGADLRGANLEQVNLAGAILCGYNRGGENTILDEHCNEADLQQVLMPGDKPYVAKFDEETILPDGAHWTSNTDMRYFTDRAYPQPWRPQPDGKGEYPWWYKPNRNR